MYVGFFQSVFSYTINNYCFVPTLKTDKIITPQLCKTSTCDIKIISRLSYIYWQELRIIRPKELCKSLNTLCKYPLYYLLQINKKFITQKKSLPAIERPGFESQWRQRILFFREKFCFKIVALIFLPMQLLSIFMYLALKTYVKDGHYRYKDGRFFEESWIFIVRGKPRSGEKPRSGKIQN